MHIINIKDFDSSFNQIQHYNIHPEMMPFVGAEYKKHKILIITESHYWPQKLSDEEFKRKTNEWYVSNNLTSETNGNVHTRGVIQEINKNKGHRIFLNLDKALLEGASLNLNHVAWYNFFQRPAMHKDGLKPNSKDIEIAQIVFEENCKILEPNLVIFASKLSFDSIHKENGAVVRKWSKELNAHQYKEYKFPIHFTAHPNSRCWYGKCYKSFHDSKLKISGHDKFVSKLRRTFN